MKAERLRLVPQSVVANQAIPLIEAVWNQYFRVSDGLSVRSWELARDYGFTDYDGRRPDWGRHKIDFSVLLQGWVDLFHTGTDLQLRWLTTLAARTKKFRAKIPGGASPRGPRTR
jgi:hypothetical protein